MKAQTSTEFSKSHKPPKHELGLMYEACVEQQYSQSSNEKQGDLSIEENAIVGTKEIVIRKMCWYVIVHIPASHLHITFVLRRFLFVCT